MSELDQDEFAIRKVVENWAIWRDAGNWERLRSVWHDDGVMQATWFRGTADEFIKASQNAWDRGVEVLHTLAGCSVEIRGHRAVAQTKMSIHQRSSVDGVLCDCVCIGRFYDLFEKREKRWAIVLRQPIYESDRLDPVDTTIRLELDRTMLAAFPSGYRHLAYLQSKAGLNVKRDLPGTRGPEVEALYAQGRRWLAEGADQ